MTRTRSLLGTAVFLALAPGTVAVLAPWWISRWRFEVSGIAWLPLQAAGAVLAAAGAVVLADSFLRFAMEGLGTPAPVAPTERLVVTGLYRHVRNPMYVAVIALILGQALLFGSRPLAVYGAAVWLCFHLFVLGYEEPTLRAAYGAEYDAFCRRVPRWIPRRGKSF